MSISRRKFIYTSSAIGASLALSKKSIFAKSPSQVVNIGLIGCGDRGSYILRYFKKIPGVNIVSLCDADQELVDKLAVDYPKASKFTDMRFVFDSPEVDAVIITTCNHWHCLAAIWAMQAGKHVYVEKPLGHTQWEGEQVIKASKLYNRICQVGTQQRSDPMQAEIKDYLHEEKALGEIQSVRVNRFGVRGSIGKRTNPLPSSKNVDLNMWIGPAEDRAIYRDKLNYDWHWDWNTGSGEMGNWGVHILDDVRNNVFLDKVTAPKAIVAGGGRYVWDDAGQTPNVHFALLETGSFPVVVTLSNLPFKGICDIQGPKSGYVTYCSHGRLEAERCHAKAYDEDGKLIKEFNGIEDSLHQQNFIDAIRQENQEVLNAPAQIGHDSTTWCNLINIASRISKEPGDVSSDLPDFSFGDKTSNSLLAELNSVIASNSLGNSKEELKIGPKLHFDIQQSSFVGKSSDRANSFIRRAYRSGFEVPEITNA